MKLSLLALSLLLLHPLLTHAADGETENGTLGLYMENNLFAGTDRYYGKGGRHPPGR